jgi:hypothetical protein
MCLSHQKMNMYSCLFDPVLILGLYRMMDIVKPLQDALCILADACIKSKRHLGTMSCNRANQNFFLDIINLLLIYLLIINNL